MTAIDHEQHRSGITLFEGLVSAPLLHETDVMSMPLMDPPAPDQMMEWATSGGHEVKVLFRHADDAMSLVWSRFAPGYPLPRHSHSTDCLYYVVSGEARVGARRIAAGGEVAEPGVDPLDAPLGEAPVVLDQLRAGAAPSSRPGVGVSGDRRGEVRGHVRITHRVGAAVDELQRATDRRRLVGCEERHQARDVVRARRRRRQGRVLVELGN
jgi:hypothetical protein